VSVFGQSYAGLYDRLYAEKDYRAECDLIEAAHRRFAASAGNRLLDIGCGTGRHSVELAARGWNVTGVDRSAPMLELARARALAAGTEISFIEGDAQNFDAGKPFDVALMMFAVIGYLDEPDALRAALANVRRHLADGGLFLFDCWYGPAVVSQQPEHRTRVIEGPASRTTRHAAASLDPSRRVATVRYRLVETVGERVLSDTEEVHSMRYFFDDELRSLLAEARLDLRSISAFPSLDQPATDADWNVFVVAAARA
jgi:SAM-dependent methyltransferase